MAIKYSISVIINNCISSFLINSHAQIMSLYSGFDLIQEIDGKEMSVFFIRRNFQQKKAEKIASQCSGINFVQGGLFVET